jgi:peptidoglycan hydrolase-like protein with peptidoglycan-binding domain
MSFQKVYELNQDGIVNPITYTTLFDVYRGIVNSLPKDMFTNKAIPFPGLPLSFGMENEYIRELQTYLNRIKDTYSEIRGTLENGIFDFITEESIKDFQRFIKTEETGIVDGSLWHEIADLYNDLRAGEYLNEGQYPGVTIP